MLTGGSVPVEKYTGDEVIGASVNNESSLTFQVEKMGNDSYLSQKTYRKLLQNLWWNSGYNIVAIPLAAGVLALIGIILSPVVGAILMSLSTIIVTINVKLLKA